MSGRAEKEQWYEQKCRTLLTQMPRLAMWLQCG